MSVPPSVHLLYRRSLQFPLILAIIYLLTFLLVVGRAGQPVSAGENATWTRRSRSAQARVPRRQPVAVPRLLPQADASCTATSGRVMQYGEWPVNDILKTRCRSRSRSGCSRWSIALLVGVGVGTLAAVHRGGVFDWSASSSR